MSVRCVGMPTAAFVKDCVEYTACARCFRDRVPPWTVFILHEGSMMKVLGDFPTVEQGWTAVRKELGIGPNPLDANNFGHARTEGEGTDGPFGSDSAKRGLSEL